MNSVQSKAQILLNRRELASLYTLLAIYKNTKYLADESGFTLEEYACHNRLKIIKKDIARLVDLQKALKADYHNQLVRARQARMIERIKVSVMANCGQCYE